VPGQSGPRIEEDEMYSIIAALGADRIQEWHEQADRDRLVIQARRARREAARADRRTGSRWARRPAAVPPQPVPVDATPDQWASALSTAAPAERVGADDRQPVGGRAS
jgi:hypothetical protein